MTLQLRQEGDALAARGDYEAAAVKYQAAVNQEPEDISLRFALGTALSHLGRREETVQQFRFVVARGRPDSTEVEAALRWLIAAGEVGEAVTFAPPKSPEASPAAASTKPVSPPAAAQGVKVTVKTEPRPGAREVKITLEGPSSEFATEKTVTLGEPVEFSNVSPGSYRLIGEDRENGARLWDLEVTVASGKDLVLDLK